MDLETIRALRRTYLTGLRELCEACSGQHEVNEVRKFLDEEKQALEGLENYMIAMSSKS